MLHTVMFRRKSVGICNTGAIDISLVHLARLRVSNDGRKSRLFTSTRLEQFSIFTLSKCRCSCVKPSSVFREKLFITSKVFKFAANAIGANDLMLELVRQSLVKWIPHSVRIIKIQLKSL